MRTKDANRQRRLLEYKPLEATRLDRAMDYHVKMQKLWEANGKRLAQITGRDPSTLSMFSEDEFRRKNEERYIISQVVNSIATKDKGAWSPLPKIGDLYAQREKVSDFKNFELVRNPEEQENVPGARPTNWFHSKYYKKRVKQLRSFIDKIKPYEPEFEGLEVVGHTPEFMKHIQQTDFGQNPNESELNKPFDQADDLGLEAEEEVAAEVSTCRISFDSNRLFFTTSPGITQSKNVNVSNEGTCAIYYKWELSRDADLMLGQGASMTSLKTSSDDSSQPVDAFDWRISDSFSVPRNMQPKTRSEFCFTQLSGSILPGKTITFSFTFKSDVSGCFSQKWIMRTTPSIDTDSQTKLSIALRGCCQVEPPDLSSFKTSIDNSLHESERSRCIEEIMSSIFDRVKKLVSMHNQAGEERIEGDVLVDDRAPHFEEVNKKWGLTYSPGLYSSFLGIANATWDALGIESQFERFWDMSVDSLNDLIMKVEDGQVKRTLLAQLNFIIGEKMTPSASGNLSYSLGYLQLSAMLEDFPAALEAEAAKADKSGQIPTFIVPKMPDAIEAEELAESSHKKHRGKKEKETTKRTTANKKNTRKGGKGQPVEDESANQNENRAELSEDFKITLKERIKQELAARLRNFEKLSCESRGVTKQLTRVNEMDKLDTNLDLEVDDDL